MKPTNKNKEELEDLERIVTRRDTRTIECIKLLRNASMLIDEDYITYQQVRGFLNYCILNLKDFVVDKERLKNE